MVNETLREERRLRLSDAAPFTFGSRYAKRLNEMRERIGDDEFDSTVRGIYTKAAFVGLVGYNATIAMLPFMYDTIKSGIEFFVK